MEDCHGQRGLFQWNEQWIQEADVYFFIWQAHTPLYAESVKTVENKELVNRV